ncbi:hypothetical protein VIGAN_11245700, partial [Vigna angularis var. angularis]
MIAFGERRDFGGSSNPTRFLQSQHAHSHHLLKKEKDYDMNCLSSTFKKELCFEHFLSVYNHFSMLIWKTVRSRKFEIQYVEKLQCFQL